MLYAAMPGLLIEGGWRPACEPATEAEAALAAVIRRLLPEVAPLLWNVRNDLPARDMAAVVAERMRLLGPARLWREVEALELRLAAARADPAGC
jgi:hypothetical protein